MSVSTSVSTKFTAEDRMSRIMSRISKSVTKFGNSATTQFSRVERAGRRVDKGMKSMAGNAAALAGGFAVGAAIQSGTRAFIGFDQAITEAGAKFQVFEESDPSKAKATMDALRKAAKDVGATSKFTAGQAAEGLNFLAMAGFNVKKSIAALPVVVDAATASGTELALATDIITDTMGAMGNGFSKTMSDAKKLQKVSDIMVKTTTTSNTTMELMFETVKESGAAFTAAGGSMAEFAAITGTMANSGIKGSKAGTAIKNMMVNLQAPTKKVSRMLNKMGINVDDGSGKMKKMSTIVGEVLTATNDWTDIQRNAALATVFGREALAGATVTMNAGAKSIDDYTKSLEDSQGITSKMAKFMGKGLGGGVAAAQSAFESIAIAIGETFRPEIDKGIKSVTKFAQKTTKWIKDNKGLIKTVVKLTKWIVISILIFKAARLAMIGYNVVLGIATFLMKGGTAAITANTVAMAAYNAMMKAAKIAQAAFNIVAAMNPIGLIVIAIIVAVAVIALMINKWDEWGAAMSMLMGPLGKVISLIQSFRKNWDMIKKSFKEGGVLGGLKAIGKVILDSILYPIQQMLELLSKLPLVGDKFAKFANKIEGFRQGIGLNVERSKPDSVDDKPVNPDVANNNVVTERKETVNEQQLKIGIEDKSGIASVLDDAGIPVELTQTLGF